MVRRKRVEKKNVPAGGKVPVRKKRPSRRLNLLKPEKKIEDLPRYERMMVGRGVGLAHGSGFRRPTLLVEEGKSQLVGVKKKVDLKSGLKIFEPEEYVLGLYVKSRNGAEIKAMLGKLRMAVPKIKEAGFAGLYCDIPNPSMANLLVKWLGMKQVPITKRAAETVKRRHAVAAGLYGSNARYKEYAKPEHDKRGRKKKNGDLDVEITRLVLRF